MRAHGSSVGHNRDTEFPHNWHMLDSHVELQFYAFKCTVSKCSTGESNDLLELLPINLHDLRLSLQLTTIVATKASRLSLNDFS